MKPGHYKIYGTKYDSFWCCTGTGFEQTAKFGQMIYAHTDDALYVNMFIPSVVTWDKGISIHQETAFLMKVLLVLLFPERLFLI